jgi:ribosomal protein S18 acetylase RimI-like enzyme
MDFNNLVLRYYIKTGDNIRIKDITKSVEVFNPEEVDIAEELANASIVNGPEKSGYNFIVYEYNNEIIGYTCFGPIPCTKNSYDLYWIVVDNIYRGMGIGKKLLFVTETKIFECGGKKIYVETSSGDSYYNTRQFYLNSGYKEEAVFMDFYGDNDNKIVYVKDLRR